MAEAENFVLTIIIFIGCLALHIIVSHIVEVYQVNTTFFNK